MSKKYTRKIIILAFFSLFVPNVCLAQEDSVTITTYFPSPVGIYDEIVATRGRIGVNYSLPGGVVAAPNYLLVEGGIGIGVPNPEAFAPLRLNVAGPAMMGDLFIVNPSNDATIQIGAPAGRNSVLVLGTFNGTSVAQQFAILNTLGNRFIIANASGQGRFYMDQAGEALITRSLGIGTTAPPLHATLEIKGPTNICVDIPVSYNSGTKRCIAPYRINIPAPVISVGTPHGWTGILTCCITCLDANNNGMCD